MLATQNVLCDQVCALRRLSEGECNTGVYGDIGRPSGSAIVPGTTTDVFTMVGMGDMDGVFTMIDVLYAKDLAQLLDEPQPDGGFVTYRTTALQAICPWALQQLNYDLDGQVATNSDARYLAMTVQKKHRFVTNYSLAAEFVFVGLAADLVVTVQLLDEKEKLET